MKVFQLHLDSEICDGTGMALVAANDYESAVSEYINNGDAGDDVDSGLIVFTQESRNPIDGLEYHDGQAVLCDCFCVCQES